MPGMFKKGCALLAMGALASCSIDAMVSDEDREMVEEFIGDIEDGNLDDLRDELDEDIRARSEPQLEAARELFPEGDHETRFIAYSINSNIDGGGRRTGKEFRLVTTDEDVWTIIDIETRAINGRQRITAWNVEAYDEQPEEVAMAASVEKWFTWVAVGGLIVLIGVIALIVWLARRSRRKMRAAPGAIPPAPFPMAPPPPPV